MSARHTSLLAIALLIVACGPSDDSPPPMLGRYDAFAWLADPLAVARSQPGSIQLTSSRERDAPDARSNEDYSNYPRESGTQKTLLEATGPGVVTRIWFTMRGVTGPVEPEIGTRVTLRMEVDGESVLVGGRTTASLAEWTDGSDPAWPFPWARGFDTTSGAYLLMVPIHFQRSFHATAMVPDDAEMYYQIDWRALPAGTEVVPMRGTATEAELGVLAETAARWNGVEPAGADRREASSATEATVMLDGPGVVREVIVEGAAPDDVIEWEIDGEMIAMGTVGRVLASPALSVDYRSSSSYLDAGRRALRYPAPFAERTRLTVRPRAPAGEVRVEVGFDTAAWDAALGTLHVDCVDFTSDVDDPVTFRHSGGPGHLAGISLVMEASMYGWSMLEGDHEASIDGAWALLGTGVEDYFGGAFYFVHGPFMALTHGLTGWNIGMRDRLMVAEPDAAMLRHHVLDTVPFREEITWRWELYTRGTRYDACTYYYLFGAN
jgi:hypothetical protein